MENNSLIIRPLSKNFKPLPRMEKQETHDSVPHFRVSSLKISPQHHQKHQRQPTKDRIPCRIQTTKIHKPGILSISTSQDTLNLNSNRNYWKKLEEPEYRQVQTRGHVFRPNCGNFVVRTLHLPQTIKSVLRRLPTSQCNKYKRCLDSVENDPYHVTNFSNSSKAASFYDLLNIHYENPTFFPYFNKNARDMIKDTIVVPIKFPTNSSFDNTPTEPAKNPIKTPKDPKKIPFLQNRYFNPQKVTCIYNYILISFESINIKNSIFLRKGVLDPLKILSIHFHIVIITSELQDRVPDILEDLELDDVKISAIYTVFGADLKNWKIFDFSEVFEDFEIDQPVKSCILFSHHLTAEEVDSEECIASCHGSYIKLNCEKVPTAKSDFKTLPIEILMPSWQVLEIPEIFGRVANYLLGYLNHHFYLKLRLDFEILMRSGFCVVESKVPSILLHRIASGSQHSSYVHNTEYKNLFIVN